MADDWKTPGTTPTVKYKIIQFATGEWAIERSESVCVAWFPNRGMAIEVCRALLPITAERQM